MILNLNLNLNLNPNLTLNLNPPSLLIAALITIFCGTMSIAAAAFASSSLINGSGGDKSSSSSIYDVLKSQGLPMGLLPKGVTEFSVDEKSGRFEAHLDRACTAKFENEVKYERNVSGTLSYGQMGKLSGISAQELFLWFPVKGIRVDIPSSGLIYFDVGVIDKQLPLSLFETPPDCRVDQSESGAIQYEDDREDPQRAVA